MPQDWPDLESSQNTLPHHAASILKDEETSVLELKIIGYTLPILLQVSLCTIFYPEFADDVFRSGRTGLQLKEESFELSIDVIPKKIGDLVTR